MCQVEEEKELTFMKGVMANQDFMWECASKYTTSETISNVECLSDTEDMIQIHIFVRTSNLSL
jgi:hypothetical protein